MTRCLLDTLSPPVLLLMSQFTPFYSMYLRKTDRCVVIFTSLSVNLRAGVINDSPPRCRRGGRSDSDRASGLPVTITSLGFCVPGWHWSFSTRRAPPSVACDSCRAEQPGLAWGLRRPPPWGTARGAGHPGSAGAFSSLSATRLSSCHQVSARNPHVASGPRPGTGSRAAFASFSAFDFCVSSECAILEVKPVGTCELRDLRHPDLSLASVLSLVLWSHTLRVFRETLFPFSMLFSFVC